MLVRLVNNLEKINVDTLKLINPLIMDNYWLFLKSFLPQFTIFSLWKVSLENCFAMFLEQFELPLSLYFFYRMSEGFGRTKASPGNLGLKPKSDHSYVYSAYQKSLGGGGGLWVRTTSTAIKHLVHGTCCRDGQSSRVWGDQGEWCALGSALPRLTAWPTRCPG